MTSPILLPGVRLRLLCADVHEYRSKYASRIDSKGVFIPSDRMRPIGARVHLKIELLDRSFGYTGHAVVTAHEERESRSGFMLRLEGTHAPGTERPSGFDPSAASGTATRRHDLAEFLFSDVPAPESPSKPLDVRVGYAHLRLAPTPAIQRTAPEPPAPASEPEWESEEPGPASDAILDLDALGILVTPLPPRLPRSRGSGS